MSVRHLSWYYLVDRSQKLTQSSHNSKQEAASQQRELDTWKESCEKLTASVGRKEMEVVTLTQKLEQLEQQVCWMLCLVDVEISFLSEV